MNAMLRECSVAIKSVFVGGAGWASRYAEYRREMVYVILALSLLLLIARIVKERRKGSPTADLFRTANWIVVLLISAVEIFYVLAMGNKATWFCKPREVGWLWTPINFVVFGLVLFNQILSFFHAMTDLKERAKADFAWERGAYSWPIAFVVAAVAGLFHNSAVVVVLFVLVVMQIIQLRVIFRSVIAVSGFKAAFQCAGVYLIGSLALAAVLMHFLPLLIIVLIGAFILYVLASGNQSSGSRKKGADGEAARCPMCGSTMGCVCQARKYQEQHERFERNHS